MANPFLDDSAFEAPPPDPSSNPFFGGDFSAEASAYPADNPFFGGEATNPFADLGGGGGGAVDLPPPQDNIFGQPTESIFEPSPFQQPPPPPMAENIFEANKENQVQNETTLLFEAASPIEDEKPKKPPPPRPTPPGKIAAQDLITTLTGQLDMTSNQLLDRIPATRTPSPVSVRDLHSPSPTPDFGDLVDVGGAETEQSNFDLIGDHSPARPPPPRPAAVAAAQPQQEEDMFDLFGTNPAPPPRPPAPKTKEDILSLFSSPAKAPAPQKQHDLLMDDNIEEVPEIKTTLVAPEPELAAVLDTVQPEKPIVDELVEPTRNELSVSPTFEPYVSSADISEVASDLPVSPSAASLELDASSIGSANPFMDQAEAPVEAKLEEVPPVEEPKHVEVEQTQVFDAQPPATTVNDFAYAANMASDYAANPMTDYAVESAYAANMATNFTASYATEPVYGAANPYEATQPVQPFSEPAVAVEPSIDAFGTAPASSEPDAFDLFAQKFEESKSKRNSLTNEDIFAAAPKPAGLDAWGGGETAAAVVADDGFGFDAEEDFGSMKISAPPPPARTYQSRRARADDSDDEVESMNVVIRPRDNDQLFTGTAPALAPPPKSPQPSYYEEADYSPPAPPVVNPFEAPPRELNFQEASPKFQSGAETPPTPLFDDDVSQPLEDFPRTKYLGPGWEMQLRSPKQKKITGNRFWKKIFVRLAFQNDTPVVQLFNTDKDKDPFQELPLQAAYSVSEISAQQFDQYGKIFTIKVQYIFYKERPGVRPGQVTKAERITNKLSKFAAYAIQGDYEGVKEFGSDLKKLGLPVEHAPQVSQLLKLGGFAYEDMKQFSMCVEEALFRMPIARDRALTYKMEEVQVTAVDELYAEQDADGRVGRQIARVRLFFLAFLSGMPTIELGVNDMRRQGKEVVGRHDIIPVATEEWIRLEGIEFHSCIQQDEYDRTHTLRFKPPDACYIELLRFRVRPPKNRELPLQLKAQWVVTGKKVELRADVLVPGFASRKLGQIPCEDVSIRFPIPECWIYLFRVEKHFRYGSVKSAHRRTGKVKGIERILGAVETLQESLIEVTSGQAKYEHHHRALVWRCPRLPKEGQGAYTTHQLVCRMALTSFDQIPEEMAPYAYVEFTMPATQVSHTTVRSVSVQDSDSDEPPEKYVRHLARHEYRVGIERTSGDPLNPYLAATNAKPAPKPIQEEPEAAKTPSAAPSDSDSDSN